MFRLTLPLRLLVAVALAAVVPLAASRAAEGPVVNSLGMKFVPVPGTKILMCTTVTTVDQYKKAGFEYRSPKFPQGGDHPAVNVNWLEANKFCAALSTREGKTYRLPTDEEWSAGVAGAGKFPWGNQWPPPSGCANFAGQEALTLTQAEAEKMFKKGWGLIKGFTDPHVYTAPVESYPANAYGLHDMGGNVWQWCDSVYKQSMNTAEALKTYRLLRIEKASGGGSCRVLRGGSWGDSTPIFLRTSCRNVDDPKDHDVYSGFRCVLVPEGAGHEGR